MVGVWYFFCLGFVNSVDLLVDVCSFFGCWVACWFVRLKCCFLVVMVVFRECYLCCMFV